MDEDTLMRDPDVTIEARLKVDPEFAIALYHEQRKRIAKLEAQVAGYERMLDEAYDEYLSGCTADELHDILKEVLEYAPRRDWEEK
jgi:hypothetical protein